MYSVLSDNHQTLCEEFENEVKKALVLCSKVSGRAYAALRTSTAYLDTLTAVKNMIHHEMNTHINDYSPFYLKGKEALLIENIAASSKYASLFTPEERSFCRKFSSDTAA